MHGPKLTPATTNKEISMPNQNPNPGQQNQNPSQKPGQQQQGGGQKPGQQQQDPNRQGQDPQR
jgi:type VI secretion system secreted protein VgrG